MTDPNAPAPTGGQDVDVPADAGDDQGPGSATGADLLVGVAHDGPLDGAQLSCRRPAGVLLVDREAGQCWLYDWRDAAFYARSTDPMPLLESGDDNRWRAAEQGQFDVQAAPWVGGDPDLVDVDDDPGDIPDGDDQDQDGNGSEVVGPINDDEGV